MNNTIDDFFNEINSLEQPKQKQPVWQECCDELTGYSYYWNIKTDEVTWSTPTEFKSIKEQKKDKMSPKKMDLYVPPRAAPLLPSTSKIVPGNSNKIYSISEISEKKKPSAKTNTSTEKKECAKPYRKNSDSEDEKIELISSYGGDTESEDDESDKNIQNNFSEKRQDVSNLSDDDDVDILTKIQKRAKELREMGGDIPAEVVKVIDTHKPEKSSPDKEKKPAGPFSLVAGYSDSEEEQENEEVKSIFSVAPESPRVSHSTLFPITKPIDVKDFIEQSPPQNKSQSPSNDFDSKAFQRKRRIGVALVNTGKKKEEVSEANEIVTKGFGFKNEDSTATAKDNIYPGFRKGGIMFVKSDVLNPIKNEENNSEPIDSKTEATCKIKKSDLEEIYKTLMEKLGFLSEGRPQVSPVQVMIIQAETLFTAMNDNGLKPVYLQKWLNETLADLIKLEKEAAPEGWLLQWDRSHKRYYYQNQATGESQWEYPQPDVSRCDEAMDISTTPPPLEPTIHLSPPLPPIIRSPTPPPPPIISKEDVVKLENSLPDVPLPPEPPASAPVKFLSDGEPLPPGVDLPEMMVLNKPKETETKASDPLFSALDSFYSDIASMENQKSPSPPQSAIEETKTQVEAVLEPPRKKKKTKVKLAPGLAMKKKGVSQLVEKWKNVQYNN